MSWTVLPVDTGGGTTVLRGVNEALFLLSKLCSVCIKFLTENFQSSLLSRCGFRDTQLRENRSVRVSIKTCLFVSHIYCPKWLKISLRNPKVMLLSSCEFVEIVTGKAKLFLWA
jgi:hypothetical protein